MSSRRADPLDLTQLRDAVATAEGALRHEDQRLRQRVEDVQALDGMLLTVWTTLLGTREDRLEQGLARVQEARQRVAAANERLDAARAELAATERADHERAERDAERILALEARADRVRGTPHPAAGELARIEQSVGELRSRLSALDEVMAAAGGVQGAASGRGWRTEGPYLSQVRRLEEALAGLGIDWSASRLAEVRRADDEEQPHSAKLRQLNELARLREELKQVLEPVLALRKTTAEALRVAQDRRDRLLDGLS